MSETNNIENANYENTPDEPPRRLLFSGNAIPRFFEKGRTLIPDKYRNKTVIYLLIVDACLMDAMNSMAMFAALVDIQQKFQTDYSTVSWVISAYAITLSGFIMVFGRMGDIIGHHIVFITGISFFCLFSLINAVITKQIVVFIVFRAFQGISGAATIPAAFALIVNYFNGPRLTKAITGLTLGLTSAGGIGLVLGGAFGVSNIGYRGFFWVSFVLSLISAVGAFFLLPPTPKDPKAGKLKDLNYTAGFLLVTGFILIILGLTEGGESWNSPKSYIPLPIGIVLVVCTPLWERFYIYPYQEKLRAAREIDEESSLEKNEITEQYDESDQTWIGRMNLLIPAGTYSVPNIFLLIGASFFNFANFSGSLNALAEYLQYVEGNSPILTAAKLLPLTVVLFVVSALYRDDIAQRLGKKWVAVAGFLVGITGNILISRIDYKQENNYWRFIFPGQILLGFGCVVYFTLYLNLILGNTPMHLQGVVSGVAQAISQTGIAVVLGVITSILGHLQVGLPKEELHQRFQHSFYFLIGIGGIEIILVLFLKDLYSGKGTVASGVETEEREAES